ncbi:MAG TPA: hypothetical protein VHA73_10020 [Acidimicrobiales bacterium]|jgi:hypothetical protein|nr:hypothetical protein [Acidimicrobiales bacterium]
MSTDASEGPRRFLDAMWGGALPTSWPAPLDVDWHEHPEPRWTLTPGSGLEVSVSAGANRAPEQLRYAMELGAGTGSLSERLDQQRAALGVVAGALPLDVAAEAVATLHDVIDDAFPRATRDGPEPAFTTWIGAVHDASDPDSVDVVKLYANVAWDPGALTRLSARWPELATLAALVPVDIAPVAFVAFETARDGARRAKVYLRPERGAGHQALQAAARVAGVDPRAVISTLHDVGLSPCLWGPWTKLCLAGSTDRAPQLTVHAALAPLSSDRRGAVADALAGSFGLQPGFDKVRAAAESSGWAAQPTVAAAGFGPSGAESATLYFAPGVPDEVRARARRDL